MTDAELSERLCRTYEIGVDADEVVIADLGKRLAYRNPDGPAAADRLEAIANKLQRMEEALSETRAERDALLQKPIDLAKMDSIDEDATDKMIAYYWWQQAQEARAALKD